MTELVNHATERSNDAAACAIKLLHHYGFDLGGCLLSQLLIDWQQHYPTAWIRLATIEALYQGRYKAISVEQILAMWQRRSQPLPHFNHDFERLVCDNLPNQQIDIAASTQSEPTRWRSTPPSTQAPQYRVALQLPNFEGSPLPETDVMLALRTLHSKEMAALQETALAETAPTEAPSSPQTSELSATQTYSYNLRSHELQSPTETPEKASSMQREDDDPPHLNEDTGHEAVDLLPREEHQEADISEPQVSGAASPEESIAPLNAQPGKKSDSEWTTDSPEPLTPPSSSEVLVSEALVSEAQSAPLPAVGAIAKILQQLEHQELTTTAELPALGLVPSPLKPKLQLQITTHYQPTWLADLAQKQPIHQFTPTSEPSTFCSKLKAVAQPIEEPQTEENAPDN